jgi:polyhydroxyalkanoate synthesis regulator phasin
MELKKSRQDSLTTNNSKNLQKAPDGSYTYRTTEMDENGEEVEIIKEECQQRRN